jgi:hypothetical protein
MRGNETRRLVTKKIQFGEKLEERLELSLRRVEQSVCAPWNIWVPNLST